LYGTFAWLVDSHYPQARKVPYMALKCKFNNGGKVLKNQNFKAMLLQVKKLDIPLSVSNEL